MMLCILHLMGTKKNRIITKNIFEINFHWWTAKKIIEILGYGGPKNVVVMNISEKN